MKTKKEVEKETVVSTEKCRIEGCKRPYRAKGYCNVHYKSWRHGELPHQRKRKGVKPVVPAAEATVKPEAAASS